MNHQVYLKVFLKKKFVCYIYSLLGRNLFNFILVFTIKFTEKWVILC